MFFIYETIDGKKKEYKLLTWSNATIGNVLNVPVAVVLDIQTKELDYIAVNQLKLMSE